jgi:hypothetical protein
MFKVDADEPSADAPTYEELRRDGVVRQLEKLKLLSDRFGINLSAPDGWQLLAEVGRFDRDFGDFQVFCCCNRLILLERDPGAGLKTAVVPTKGIFLSCDL